MKPVDSVHFKLFVTHKPGILSPLALHVLTDNQRFLRVVGT